MLVTLQTVQEIPMCVNFSPALVSQCVVYSTVFYKVVLTCGTVYHFLSVQCIQIEFQAQVGTPRATPPPPPPTLPSPGRSGNPDRIGLHESLATVCYLIQAMVM